MKFFVVIAALASVASAGIAPIVIIPSAGTTLLRNPALDSAVVQSERLGGNFAYSIAEGQQFQSVAPLIATNALRAPIGLSYPYALNQLPLWSSLNGQRIIIDQQLDQSIRDEAQKQWDRQLEVHEQVVQAQRQLEQNQEDSIREQINQQIQAQQLIIQQQQLLNDQAAQAVQQATVAQQVQAAQIVATAVPVAPTAEASPAVDNDDSVVIESADARSETVAA